jgi:sterol desaturase/sphingolipid hydroxylase (fatty acid hydroxylase superfamily)
MLDTVVLWYASHAKLLFAILVVTAILLEQARRVWDRSGAPDPDETESAMTSLASGAAFLAMKAVIGKLAITTLALVVYERYRLFTLDVMNPLVWVGVFVVRDFVYYWVHRAEHRVRVLWASHMVHHSPETIGFTTAVRVPWMEAVYKPWLGLWVPLIGFHPVAFVALDIVAAAIGQLYHTERVRQIPVLDRWFVTPSTHRVHHGSNPEYIDKNFGAVFIVWDRWFGTYQPEVAPVVYGIGRKKIDSPMDALVGGYPALVDEVRGLPSWSARVRHAFAPPA